MYINVHYLELIYTTLFTIRVANNSKQDYKMAAVVRTVLVYSVDFGTDEWTMGIISVW